MKPVPLSDLTCATFAALLHSTFRVRVGDFRFVELELQEATPYSAASAKGSAAAATFSLVFTGPKHSFLPQCIYAFEHDQLGAFDLFIVPIGQEAKGFLYEAIFNRPVPPPAPTESA